MATPQRRRMTTAGPAEGPRMFLTLRQMQITGSTRLGAAPVARGTRRTVSSSHRSRLQTVADLSVAFLDTLNSEEMRAYERHATFNGRKRSFAHLIREVYDLVDSAQCEKKELRRLVHEIVQRVLDPHGSGGHMPLGDAHISDSMARFVASERETFLRMGGAECLLRVIHAMRMDVASPVAQHQRSTTMRDRNDVRAMWETPLPHVEEGSKNRHDAASRKAVLNDAMVRAVMYAFDGLQQWLTTASSGPRASCVSCATSPLAWPSSSVTRTVSLCIYFSSWPRPSSLTQLLGSWKRSWLSAKSPSISAAFVRELWFRCKVWAH